MRSYHRISLSKPTVILISNLGPCALDEVFFPYSSASPKAIGNCFKLKFSGQVRFGEVDDICKDSYGKGSQRSSFSQRDPEYGLLMGAVDFLNIRSISQRCFFILHYYILGYTETFLI